jgi:hypothetical protein
MSEGHLLDDFDFGLAEPLIERSKLEAAEEWGCAASWSSLSLRARRGVDSEDLDDRWERSDGVEPLVGGGELERAGVEWAVDDSAVVP